MSQLFGVVDFGCMVCGFCFKGLYKPRYCPSCGAINGIVVVVGDGDGGEVSG